VVSKNFLGRRGEAFIFSFFARFFGRRVCMSGLKILGKNLQKKIQYGFFAEKYPNSKTNWLNRSPYGGDIYDLKLVVLQNVL